MTVNQANLFVIDHEQYTCYPAIPAPFLICTKKDIERCSAIKAFCYHYYGLDYCFCKPENTTFVCTAQVLGLQSICDRASGRSYFIGQIQYCLCPIVYRYFGQRRSTQFPQSPSLDEAKPHPYCGDYRVKNGWLFYYRNKYKSYFPLCNFYFEPAEARVHLFRQEATQTVFLLNLFLNGEKRTMLTVNNAAYKTIVQDIWQKYAEMMIDPTATRVNEKIDHYLALTYQHAVSTGKLKQSFVYRSSGWQLWNNRLLYMEDSKSGYPFNCETGFRIPYSQELPPPTAYNQAMEFLNVADTKSLSATLIPLLVLHLGIAYTLFNRAGFPIRFLLYIFGPSGSMKTSMTSALFYPFSEDTPNLKSTFKDTATSIEVKMANIFDWVFRIDDYHPQENPQAQLNLKNTLETVIRYWGDIVGKGRSNPSLENIAAKKPHSICCITGEKTDGTLSSYLRCLFLRVETGTYIGEKLAIFQRNPLLLSTHLHYFIEHLEESSNAIINFIGNNINDLRGYYGPCIKEPRLIDAAVQLHLISDIILQYGLSIKAISEDDQQIIKSCWQSEILVSVALSRTMSRIMTPTYMYIKAVQSLIDSRSIRIAPSKQQYIDQPNTYDGFSDATYLYLIPDICYQKVKHFWRATEIEYTEPKESTHRGLYQANLLRTSSEGKERDNFLYRTSLPNRPRVLALDIKAIERILENA